MIWNRRNITEAELHWRIQSVVKKSHLVFLAVLGVLLFVGGVVGRLYFLNDSTTIYIVAGIFALIHVDHALDFRELLLRCGKLDQIENSQPTKERKFFIYLCLIIALGSICFKTL